MELRSEAAKDGAVVVCSVPQCDRTVPGTGLVVKKLPLTLVRPSLSF